MVHQQKYNKNTTKQESIYAWYPQAQTLLVKENSKDIYSKLGTRAPKPEAYCGTLKIKMLFQNFYIYIFCYRS